MQADRDFRLPVGIGEKSDFYYHSIAFSQRQVNQKSGAEKKICYLFRVRVQESPTVRRQWGILLSFRFLEGLRLFGNIADV